MIKILPNLKMFLAQNANFFAIFFGENIFKIKTSVPGQRFLEPPTKSTPNDAISDAICVRNEII
jgi:hypothetical protein